MLASKIIQAESAAAVPGPTTTRPLTSLKELFGECLCVDPVDIRGLDSSTQFVELNGIEFIGLGAVTDELSPKERVYYTMQQISESAERLISIGHLVEDETELARMTTESVPLDVWNKAYPDDDALSRFHKQVISNIKKGKFEKAMNDFRKEYARQKALPLQDKNMLTIGITVHNMGVISVLAGNDKVAMHLFQDAIELKKDAFGADHPEVAVSLDELGIQLFSNARFEEALFAFTKSKNILLSCYGSKHSRICMLLNNIACCAFQMGDSAEAASLMQEARELQRERNESSAAKADLDLLHLAILLSNHGYLKAQLKEYEEASACFEEALLIQQSVLGDSFDHRAIHDSRTNLDFVNAFHS